jgi:hypothetical protein
MDNRWRGSLVEGRALCLLTELRSPPHTMLCAMTSSSANRKVPQEFGRCFYAMRCRGRPSISEGGGRMLDGQRGRLLATLSCRTPNRPAGYGARRASRSSRLPERERAVAGLWRVRAERPPASWVHRRLRGCYFLSLRVGLLVG